MTGWLDEFFVHSASVEPLLGSGGAGDVYAAPSTVPCFIETARKVHRRLHGLGDSEEAVVGVGTLYCDPAYEPLFPPDSRITVGGVTYRAGQVNSNTLDDTFPEQLAVSLL